MGLWTYDASEQHVQIVPYEDFGPPADYSEKIAKAKATLGAKWALSKAHKVSKVVREIKLVAV